MDKLGVYVELDCLLDTRLATIARIDQELAVKVVREGYHKRMSDHFPGVPLDKFKELYDNRDHTTLEHSVCTPVVRLVGDIVKEFETEAQTSPIHKGGFVTVNCYPYDVDDEEREILRQSLAVWMGNDVEIEVTSFPREVLEPQYVISRYAVLVMYDYYKWMDMHVKGFETTPLASVRLIAPALYIDNVPDKATIRRWTKEADNPLRALATLASPLVDLEFADAELFSALYDPNGKK